VPSFFTDRKTARQRFSGQPVTGDQTGIILKLSLKLTEHITWQLVPPGQPEIKALFVLIKMQDIGEGSVKNFTEIM
jgi:hypothetical protein